MTLSDIIQLLAVLAAVGASIIALVIASKDRQHAAQIAEDDRRTAIEQARLMVELEAAKRLSRPEAATLTP